jgi:hypothetical protein
MRAIALVMAAPEFTNKNPSRKTVKLARHGPDLIHTQRAVGYSLRLPRG